MSIYIWALVTGSEHTLAPHPLRDQQPADQHNAWRLSDYSFCARMHHAGDRANNRGSHDVALRRVLTTYAVDALAVAPKYLLENRSQQRQGTPTFCRCVVLE